MDPKRRRGLIARAAHCAAWGASCALLGCTAGQSAAVGATLWPDEFYFEVHEGNLDSTQFPGQIDFGSQAYIFGTTWYIGGPREVREVSAIKRDPAGSAGSEILGDMSRDEVVRANATGIFTDPNTDMSWISPDIIQSMLFQYSEAILAVLAIIGGASWFVIKRNRGISHESDK